MSRSDVPISNDMVRNQGSSAGHAVHDSSSRSFPSRNGNRKRRGPTNLDTHSKPKVKVIVNANTVQTEKATEIVPVEIQQAVLDTFKTALIDVLGDDSSARDVKSVVQEVKGHLYNRDFAKAFGSEEYLEVYTARWSASRALGYVDVFTKALGVLADRKSVKSDAVADKLSASTANLSLDPSSTSNNAESTKVVCLGGGGGAELCGLVAASTLLELGARLEIVVVDSADWSEVLHKLENSLRRVSSLSKDDSEEAKTPRIDSIESIADFSTTFQQLDVLNHGEHYHTLDSSIGNADIITLAFTLNELYTASMTKTQKFLLNLTISAKPGSLLLIIDSPGSYSSVTLNGSEKQYPMQWLLEHTLLTTAPKALAPETFPDDSSSIGPNSSQNAKPSRPPRLWDCVESTDSRWFRIPPSLKYPLELEHMRYQMSLWRRL